MKILQILFFCCTLSATLHAQWLPEDYYRFTSEQYIGLPGLDNVGLELNYVEHYADNNVSTQITSSTSTPHFGFKVDYLINPKLSFGFDFRYIQSRLGGQYQSNGNIYSMNMKKERLGFLPSLFLHVGEMERIDVNLQFGAGIKYKRIEEASNEPNFAPRVTSSETYKLSLRAGIGFRGYILPRFGMCMNVGFGHGGIFQFGTVFRL